MDSASASPARLPVTALCELSGIALLLRLAGAWGPGWLPASSLAVALFLYVPLFRYRGKGWPEWAVRISDGKRSAATLAGVLALGCAAYFLWLALPIPAFLRPGVAPPPARPVSFVVHQAAVGLSEEVFFRGYLYDAFDRHGRRPLLPVSLLFAALHLAVFPTPWRALTFF
ncbi:MAG TPA: CPBP family glutamic-type intramembrane protease, partial [Candidatus Deferrimicrobiaceae bacterium]